MPPLRGLASLAEGIRGCAGTSLGDLQLIPAQVIPKGRSSHPVIPTQVIPKCPSQYRALGVSEGLRPYTQQPTHFQSQSRLDVSASARRLNP